jgi:exodeoxyribonuclease VIII
MSEFFKIISYEIKKDSNETYHGNKDYISASGLKKIKKSPLHFKEEEQKDTEALQFGSAYHTFILENESFADEYFVFDDTGKCQELINGGARSPRATNAYKDWYNDQMSIINGKQVIDLKTNNIITAMRDRLMSHRYVRSLLSNGEAEMSVYCEIEIMTGQRIKIKIRPDYKKDQKRIISDLKSTIGASVYDFPRHAADLDYHLQAALYSDIMDAIEGKELGWSFFFIAQEKVIPYAFNIFEASPQFLAQGRYEYEQLLMLYAWCLENNKFPDYQIYTQSRFGVNELKLPSYYIREINWYSTHI